MEHIGAYEAKTHLPKLLDRVAHGESLTITRHGKPGARLVPVATPHEQAERGCYTHRAPPPLPQRRFRDGIDQDRP